MFGNGRFLRETFSLVSRKARSASGTRVFKSVSVQGFGTMVILVGQLLQAPLILRYWTSETFTLWLSLFTVPSLLWTLETGYGQVISDEMVRAVSAGKLAHFTRLERTSCMTYVLLAVGASVVLLGAHAILSLQNSDFWGESRGSSMKITICMIAFVVFGFLSCYARAPLRALERNHWVSALGIAVRGLELLSPILSVIFGSGILGATLILSIGTGLVSICSILLYLSVRRGNGFPDRAFRWELDDASIYRNAFGIQCYQLASVLQTQGIFLLVRSNVSSDVALLVSTGRSMLQAGLLPVNAVAAALSPELCAAESRKPGTDKSEGIKPLCLGALSIAVFGAVIIYTVGPSVLAWWTHGHAKASFYDSASIALVFALTLGLMPYTLIMNAKGAYHLWSVRGSVVIVFSSGAVAAVTSFGYGYFIWPALALSSGILFIDRVRAFRKFQRLYRC